VLTFADDCVVTGYAKTFLEQAVQPLVERLLAERGLERALAKTRLTHIEEGCDLLGTQVRKDHGKLLCPPAKKHGHALLTTVRRIVTTHKHAPAGFLMRQLHPVMRGGAQYHQHGASKRTCATVDHAIFTVRWQWARRRHPQKSRTWIKEKYCRSANGKHGVVFGHVRRSKGHVQDVRLFHASAVPLRRHLKIKGEANPYDPAWEPYCEARWG
jgi:RNA-directed DNA polymerase